MVEMKATKEEIFQFLEEIMDPEIPVLNIVEMGIVRNAQVDLDTVKVDITPTYFGCAAMNVIEREIISTLNSLID